MNATHNLNLESFPTGFPVSTGKYPYGKGGR